MKLAFLKPLHAQGQELPESVVPSEELPLAGGVGALLRFSDPERGGAP